MNISVKFGDVSRASPPREAPAESDSKWHGRSRVWRGSGVGQGRSVAGIKRREPQPNLKLGPPPASRGLAAAVTVAAEAWPVTASNSLGFPKPAGPRPETRLAGYKRKRAIPDFSLTM